MPASKFRPSHAGFVGLLLASSACLSPRFEGTGSSDAPTFGTGGTTGTGPGPLPGSTVGNGGSEQGVNPGGFMGGGQMPIDTSGGTPPAVCASYDAAAARVRVIPDADSNPALAARVEGIPLDQRIRQMYGFPNCDYNSGAQCFQQQPIPEHGLPVWEMRDGPRGVRRLGGAPATSFPTPVARAASFDLDLEERIGDVIGKEMLAFKYDLMLAPMINTTRYPGWGRAQETYGEDTVVLGEMGAAFVRGVQRHVPACIKHFAANTTEDNRQTVSADMDEQTLREVYTRQFEIAIEKSDPACVMAAYNRVNNVYSAENPLLLRELLREEWGWEGFVISDWEAARSTVGSALAGLDLEMPRNAYYGSLAAQITSGTVPVDVVNAAVRRILNIKRFFGQLDAEYREDAARQSRPVNEAAINDQATLALVQEAAEKGMVLLENRDSFLPLADGNRVLLVGPDGNAARLGDRGSSQVDPAPNLVINPLQGLQQVAAAHGATVDYQAELAAAVSAAPSYDTVILVVGMQNEDEGEGFLTGGDRENLDLNGPHPEHWPAGQKPRAWIEQLATANPNLLVVLNVGGAVLDPAIERARGLIYSFYPGQSGGLALARLLFGDVNFSAKLPITIANDGNEYPPFGNTGASAAYDYYHGYRKFDADPAIEPRYHFGAGLSYTTFEYSDPIIACSSGVSANGMLVVEVDVENTGAVPGTEVVQLYVGYPNTAQRRSVKELKAFRRVDLQPGETKRVQLTVPARDLRYYDAASGWQLEFVEHTALVGPSADPTSLRGAPFTIVAN